MISNLKDEDQHQHSNGGGWVANTATVAKSVYVGPFAIVYGKATCTGNARVEDYAQVSGTARLGGSVRVCRVAWVDQGEHSEGCISTNERERPVQRRIRPTIDWETI